MTRQSPPSRGKPPRIWQGEKLQAVLEELRKGRPLSLSCRLQGHEPDSLEELMARDVEVRGLVETARSFGQTQLLDSLLAVAPKDGASVTKLTWLLERLNPKAFRPPPQKLEQEHTGKDGAPLPAPTLTLTIEAARELAAKGTKHGQ